MNRLIAFAKRRFAAILVALFSLSLVPVLAVSVYDFPMSDDYHYGLYVHQTVVKGQSVWKILRAAGMMVNYAYIKWQGTYSAIFVMSMQPGSFADWAYWLVPSILLGLLIFSTFKLLHTVLCVCLSEKLRTVAFLGVPVLFLSIQYLPSANQGFFWFNGASYYTLFYSIMLLYIDTLILFFKSENRWRAVRRFIIAVLLAAILGGANYVTALLTLLAGLLFLAYCVFKKRDRLAAIAVQIVAMGGFAINVMAPGNAVRQATIKGMNVPDTLLNSIRQAGIDIYFWSALVVTVFILIIPLLYRIAGRSRLSFRYPLLFLIFTFLLFSAQNAPPFYAMSAAGPERLRNIVFYSFIWLILIDLFYLLGWVSKRRPEPVRAWHAVKRWLRLREGSKVIPCCAVALFIIISLIPSMMSLSTSLQCTDIIFNGEAHSYGVQMETRLKLYENPSVRIVNVPPLTVAPQPLHFYEDLTEDPSDYNNHTIANYYKKFYVAITNDNSSLKNLGVPN